jgi:hypothetical protein
MPQLTIGNSMISPFSKYGPAKSVPLLSYYPFPTLHFDEITTVGDDSSPQ